MYIIYNEPIPHVLQRAVESQFPWGPLSGRRCSCGCPDEHQQNGDRAKWQCARH